MAVAKQILLQAAPLAVGDEVVCTHGTGILVDFISLDHPCSVKFTHGPHQHTSKFESARKAKGGGRVQRVPVSFAHDGRSTRKDSIATNQQLLDKVRHCHSASLATVSRQLLQLNLRGFKCGYLIFCPKIKNFF